MHARLQELISLRDGEPVGADAAQHVAECGACSAQLERLARLRAQLSRLPAFEPLPHNWSAIQEKLNRPAARTARRRARWPLAAAVCGAAVLLFLFARLEWMPAPGPGVRSPAAIEPLVARSQQLEDILQRLPRRPSVERVATSAAIDDLQNQIQVLDLQLTAAQASADRDQAHRLWRERVDLLNSLVSVRYAEAARGGYLAHTSGAI